MVTANRPLTTAVLSGGFSTAVFVGLGLLFTFVFA